jgi:hypothetical protein
MVVVPAGGLEALETGRATSHMQHRTFSSTPLRSPQIVDNPANKSQLTTSGIIRTKILNPAGKSSLMTGSDRV